MIRFLAAVALVAGCLGAVAPRPAVASKGDQWDALASNRALWGKQHLRSYRFRLRVRCFCPAARKAVTITVRDGSARGGSGFQKHLDTVPELFRQIRHTLDDPEAGEVSVTYDAKRGFPRRASLDKIEYAIDDELGWTVDRFRAITR